MDAAAALWRPGPDRVARAELTAFATHVGVRGGYEDLHAWSVEDPGRFWSTFWSWAGIVGEPGGVALDPGASMYEARFFPEGRLSAVDNLLGTTGDAVAVVALDEAGARRELTWDELRAEVASLAATFADLGVGRGDRVAGFVPNGVEAIVSMLAAAARGAVYSSTSPDFGADGVLDRFGQIEPVVLVGATGYSYGGRWFDRRGVLDQVAGELPSVRRTIRLGEDWATTIAAPRGAALEPEVVAFDHPWYVLYSSGTTGKPKPIVHGTGAVVLKHREEQRLQSDLKAGDRLLYVTTCGWMMWNWLVSALGTGASIVCYDGNVAHPGIGRLWEIAEAEAVTHLGVGAKYLDLVAKAGYRPGEEHDLSAVRTLLSTGSPLSADRFRWVYDAVSSDVHLASISGGTDLCGCFVGGDPTSPVHAGEIQRPFLGMAMDVYDESGQRVADRPAVQGELVCTAPFPTQPLGFWGDDDGSRYRAAYWERFPGVWHHGDFASRTEHGGFVIHGRSDTTLNPGGVRMGTAEIYRVVEGLDGVAEAMVFAQSTGDGDVRIVLAVVPRRGADLDDELRATIVDRIRRGCSPRHVPRAIVAVPDLPRTRSGKLVELAAADVTSGREVRNVAAIANPEALWALRDHPDLALS